MSLFITIIYPLVWEATDSYKQRDVSANKGAQCAPLNVERQSRSAESRSLIH